ncbi:MAG: 30S ribosomal protein S7, partial [Candidatus Doudnabacteria bacterium CG10_big_fil_rev_8_21_14_0_10_42_18]
MPRKARSFEKRIPKPDPKFGNVKYAKFINYLMQRGKKNVATRIFYDAIDIVSEKIKAQKSAEGPKDGRQMFDVALKNVSPLMELKSRRIGGSNYQVPMEVMEPRRTTLGMRWMITAAQARKGIPMAGKLAAEIMDAFARQGAAVKKREDVHRMAEA